jgi:hypothetical protein
MTTTSPTLWKGTSRRCRKSEQWKKSKAGVVDFGQEGEWLRTRTLFEERENKSKYWARASSPCSLRLVSYKPNVDWQET